MIDLRIMNDFTDNEQSSFLEYFARCVSKIDGALDTVAEPKLLGQTHSRVADRNNSPGVSYFFNDIAAIMRLHLLLDGRHYVRRTQIHLLLCRRAAGNQVRAHIAVVILIPQSREKNFGSIHHRAPKQQTEMRSPVPAGST